MKHGEKAYPVVAIGIGDKTFRLCFTLYALNRLQLIAGKDLLRGDSIDVSKADDFLALLWASSLSYQPEMEISGIEALQRMIPKRSYPELQVIIVSLLEACFPAQKIKEAGESASSEAIDEEGQSDWLELYSLGVMMLGLEPKTFWRLTPAQLDSLVIMYRRKLQQTYGTVASAMCGKSPNEIYPTNEIDSGGYEYTPDEWLSVWDNFVDDHNANFEN